MRSGPRKYGAGLCTAALLVAAATQCTFSLPALVADQDAEPDGAAEGGPDAPLDAPDASRDATLDAVVDSAPDTVDAPTDAPLDAPTGCPSAGSVLLVKGGLSQPTSVKVDSTYVYWSALDGTLALLPKDAGAAPCHPLPGANLTAINDIAIDPVRLFYVWGNEDGGRNGIQAGTVEGACSDASVPDFFYGQPENGIPHSVALPYAPGVAATSAFYAQTSGDVYGCSVLPADPNPNPGLCFAIAGQDGPYRITADADHIYWTNNGGGALVSALLDGGAVTKIVADAGHQPMGIAVDPADGGYVYWGDQAGNILRANKDGTGVTQIVPGVTPGAESLTLDAKYVYWVATGDGGPASGAVLRAPLAGGCTTTLAAAQDNPWNLAVDPADGGSVYWVNNVDDGGIYQVVNPP